MPKTSFSISKRLDPKPQTTSNGTAVNECEQSDMPRLIRIDEVSRILGFQKSFIYNLAATGQLKPLKFGVDRRAAVRWLLSDVLAYVQLIANQRKAPEPPQTSGWN